MRKEKIEEYNIPLEAVPAIKAGGDYLLADGTIVPHLELTRGAQLSRSFAFCSDTSYNETIIPQITGVYIIYNEATFLDELKERARQTMHSTSKEAATIASKAQVGKLIIGHYSQRYFDLSPLLDEAQAVFPNTYLA